MTRADISPRRGSVGVTKTDSIAGELDRLHQQISARAYDLSRNHGGTWRGPIADWLTAERELVRRPAIELRQKGEQLDLIAALPGIDAKGLDVQVTTEDVLIKANEAHAHTSQEGVVHVCEFAAGNVFRSIHLPAAIDPESATADYCNGLLRVTANIATLAR